MAVMAASASFDRARVAGRAAVGVVVGLLLAILWLRFPYGLIPGDAFTYLSAGERLNAGHPLYALSPGDRPVVLEPPYWTVPLLSPPPIAVLWRPLAALPAELGVYLWWAVHVTAVATAILLVAARRPVAAAIAIVILAFPFAYELSVANLNGFVLLGLVLTWRATAMGEERGAGALSGVLTAFKLTPALLGWWLVVGRRWTAVRWGILAGLATLAVSVVGAGLDAHVTFLSIIGQTAAGGARPMSLGGIGEALGIPAGISKLLPLAALIAGTIAIWLLRRRPDWAFVTAIATMVLGSPTVSISWYALFFAMLAPLAWPWQPARGASDAASMPAPAPDLSPASG
jgi:hypothetical protein